MKTNKIFKLTIIIALFFYGCQSNKNESKLEENEFQSIDTILQRNEENFTTIIRASEKSDSSITKKVEKTVNKIQNLQEENKQLKSENNALKEKLDVANDVGKPFKLLPVSNDKDN